MKRLCLILVLTTILTIQAFSQRNADVSQLSKDADVILIGKVTAKKSEWNSDKTRILTRVTIKVDEYLTTEQNQTEIIVTHAGGEIGAVGELYSHTPAFAENEDVLLFLQRDSKNNYLVLNGDQGKFTLLEDNSGDMVTSFHKKISALKNEIKSLIGTTR